MATLIDKTDADLIGDICRRFRNRPEALLEIMHELQAQVGFISKSAVRAIADKLNLSQAEVYGVVTFYHDFRREPPGRTIIKICRAEACQAVGSEALAAHAEKILSVKTGAKSADGAVSLDAVYCLGNCALGPTVMINDELYGRVTENRFDELVSLLGADEARNP